MVGRGGLIRDVSHHGCAKTKNLKITLKWLKCPKTVPKNEIWTGSQMMKNIIFAKPKCQSQQKLAERVTHFTI